MGEEFYAAIKLITGEEIFALVCVDENDEDPVLIVQNPVIMKMFTNHAGTYVKIKPWMEIPEDDFYIFKLDKIVTMTEVKNTNTINFYKKYLSDDQTNLEIDGKVNISNKMGYIGSVENSRKKLENLFKDNKES